MKRIAHTYSCLSIIISLIALNCIKTSYAQSSLSVSTTQEVNETEKLDYMVTTWSSPITKEEAKNITSISDFWSKENKLKYRHDAFKEIWVVNLKDYHDWTIDVNEIEPDRKATSPTEKFTKEQLAIVANADYSDHLRFSARFNSTNLETRKFEENVLVSQSVSIVPDVQATYKGGMEALETFLKDSSRDHVKHVKRNHVGRFRVFFTVTKQGSITKVNMVESSNYSDVDQVLIKIIKDLPLMWTPAQNKNGEKIDQEFVFTFGRAGC